MDTKLDHKPEGIDVSVGKMEFKLSKEDPWKHRSDFMKCKSCIWFVPKEVNTIPVYHLGRCRRHAPTMNGFPVVYVNDWCGDHKVDEKYVAKING